MERYLLLATLVLQVFLKFWGASAERKAELRKAKKDGIEANKNHDIAGVLNALHRVRRK